MDVRYGPKAACDVVVRGRETDQSGNSDKTDTPTQKPQLVIKVFCSVGESPGRVHAKGNFILFRAIREARFRRLVGIWREDYGYSARWAATNYPAGKQHTGNLGALDADRNRRPKAA